MQVVNHDIPQPVLDAALKAARDFFEMPSKEKQSYEKETSESNGSDNGIQSLESKDKVVDWGDVMFHEDLKNWPANPPDYKYAATSNASFARLFVCRSSHRVVGFEICNADVLLIAHKCVGFMKECDAQLCSRVTEGHGKTPGRGIEGAPVGANLLP